MNIFQKLFRNVKDFLMIDAYVNKHRKEQVMRNQRGIALLGFIAFMAMSVVNIFEQSWIMLYTTLGGGIIFLVGYLVAKFTNDNKFLMSCLLIVYIGLFSAYTLGINGGNEGFAALWVLLATYVALIGIDFKFGFLASIYFIIFIFVVYQTPAQSILQYNFNTQFRIRFPYLFMINFGLAVFIIVNIQKLQYNIIKKQEELEKIYNMDQLTNVYNRNNFIEFSKKHSINKLQNVGCLYVDLNGLHKINNLKGHEYGDDVLKDLAYSLKNSFAGDNIFRMGGDEFLAITIGTSEEDFNIKIKNFSTQINGFNLSVSKGSAYSKNLNDIESLVKIADKNMLTNKDNYYKDKEIKR